MTKSIIVPARKATSVQTTNAPASAVRATNKERLGKRPVTSGKMCLTKKVLIDMALLLAHEKIPEATETTTKAAAARLGENMHDKPQHRFVAVEQMRIEGKGAYMPVIS